MLQASDPLMHPWATLSLDENAATTGPELSPASANCWDLQLSTSGHRCLVNLDQFQFAFEAQTLVENLVNLDQIQFAFEAQTLVENLADPSLIASVVC